MMDMELEQMSETPTRRTHRRAQSETFFRLPDFDEDVVLDDFTFDFNDPNPNPNPRGFSLDADFFAGLDFANNNSLEPADSTKKAMPPHQLARLALVDPKRAKRILANRQSASRSKERKIRYTGELERKVQTLQAEATTLSAEVTKLQRDTSGLTTENKELQLRLQAMEQAARLRDALNDALSEELKHLKIIVGEVQIDKGNNARQYAQFSFNSFNTPQTQYAQQQQQQQLHRPLPTSSNTDPGGALQPNFPGYN